MTSSSSMSLRPFLKSSSMFSICVPAFLKWELHQAVKVWERGDRGEVTLYVTYLTVWQIHSHTPTASTITLPATHTQTHAHKLITQLDVSLWRAGSKLLSKAWTVHFNLWPCYCCSRWRWDTVRHLCQFDGHCWRNSPETSWNCHLVYLYISYGLYTRFII